MHALIVQDSRTHWVKRMEPINHSHRADNARGALNLNRHRNCAMRYADGCIVHRYLWHCLSIVPPYRRVGDMTFTCVLYAFLLTASKNEER